MVTEADERAPKPAGKSPVRTCAVTRQEALPADLIRFAAGPDGTIVPDLACKLPGRGVWIGCDRQLVAEAVKTRAFSRSLKRETKAGADLPDLVEALMQKRLVAALSLANKAGLALTGFTKVDSAVNDGTVMVLLHGFDSSPGGSDKLDRRYLAMCRDAGRTPHIVRCFAIAQLSLALGRANVVHAALMMGGAAQNFLSEAGRLERYRTGRQDVDQRTTAAEQLPPTDLTEHRQA